MAATSDQEFHACNEFVRNAIRPIAFFLFCRKYTNLRITLFNKLNLKISVLKPNTNEVFKLLYELMSPNSAVDTKLIRKFIHEASELSK